MKPGTRRSAILLSSQKLNITNQYILFVVGNVSILAPAQGSVGRPILKLTFPSLQGNEVFTTLTASVRNQLRFAFAIVIILSFLSTAVAIWRLQVLSNDTNELTHRPLAKE